VKDVSPINRRLQAADDGMCRKNKEPPLQRNALQKIDLVTLEREGRSIWTRSGIMSARRQGRATKKEKPAGKAGGGRERDYFKG